jgi:hypothetical protein
MFSAKNNRKRMRETRKTMVGASGEPLGAKAPAIQGMDGWCAILGSNQ